MFTTVNFIIIGVALVFSLAGYAWREARKHETSAGEELVGICASAIETASQKDERKEKALELLREKNELSNAELRKHLGVAGRTVVKYMSELERENKVEQVGATGRGVVYRAK